MLDNLEKSLSKDDISLDQEHQLFQPFHLTDDLRLKNRIVMAPLTRSSADENLVPTEAMAAYYARRADAGLIISEAILVSQDGQGYPNSPGIYSKEQIAGWKNVTDRVHAKGGKIFAQIWHTGRLSHSIYRQGEVPIAPSAIGWHGHVPQTDGLLYENETPKAMTQADIGRIVHCFAQAAQNAIEAGFDGVEIHGANGYLIDQFLHWSSNQRTDEYGGSTQNMSKFLFQILDAIKAVIPEERIGLRLSPHSGVGEDWRVMDHDDRDKEVFIHVLTTLNQCNLAYVHKGMYDDKFIDSLNSTPSQFIRQYYQGVVMACGGYTITKGEEAIKNGVADLIAFGTPFIANHDFVERIKSNKTLIEYDVNMLATLY